LDWRTKVELYEQIRREYEFGSGSIIGVARKLGVHRRTVREEMLLLGKQQRADALRPSCHHAVLIMATICEQLPVH